MISYAGALEKFARLQPLSFEHEALPISECINRTLAKPIFAPFPSPRFTNSAMDGYAFAHVDAEQTRQLKIMGTQFAAGKVPHFEYVAGHCLQIMTGAPVPEWADTIIPIEKTRLVSESLVEFLDVPIKGANLRRKGEDIERSDLILKENDFLTAERIMIAAFFGLKTLTVWKRPRILLFTTGDEIKDVGQAIEISGVYNSSRYFLEASLEKMGLSPNVVSHLEDKEEVAQKIVGEYLHNFPEPTLIMTTGAVSAGDKDFIPKIAEHLGFSIVFHKVAVRPGKPIFFAEKNNCFWLGIPGNPISTVTAWHFFARQLLAYWAHFPLPYIENYKLLCDIYKPLELCCFFRGKITNRVNIAPFENQGSAHLFASTQADAYFVAPEGQSCIKAGTTVDVLRI